MNKHKNVFNNGLNLSTLIVERIHDQALLPMKANHGDLGYDLFASEERIILPGMVSIVPTGIRIQFPSGYGARICDRSSVATKDMLLVVAGVIDEGYRGEIKVALHNINKESFHILPGKKIAQLVPMLVTNFNIIESEVSIDTNRGVGGFGSTGS
jgi:dUTP pyrophosphatase